MLHVTPRGDAYSPREIALAAGVPVDQVTAIVGDRLHVPYQEALRIGRALAGLEDTASLPPVDRRLFSIFSPALTPSLTNRVSLALSGSVHVGLIAGAILLAVFATKPEATMLAPDQDRELVRLVFLSIPGPGGGGGGGGLLGKSSPSIALSAGRHTVSSPLPVHPPPSLEPVQAPPEPKRTPLEAEPLPIVVAPIVAAPADSATRIGVLLQTSTDAENRGQGRGGGLGSGIGTGDGQGDGPGLGPGSGGGTRGGPYRRGITGDVVLEIVVRRDGSVGDIKVLRGLGWGLDERAEQAVSQWRFTPAQRQGTPVDVIVEVAVEFKFR